MAPNRYHEEESYDFDPRLARETSTPAHPAELSEASVTSNRVGYNPD
jgi:hypothetical protein